MPVNLLLDRLSIVHYSQKLLGRRRSKPAHHDPRCDDTTG